MNAASVLKKTFLFRDFPEAGLKKLAAVAKEDILPPETPVFREGETGEAGHAGAPDLVDWGAWHRCDAG